MAILTSRVDTKKGGFTSEARLSIGLGIVVGLGQVKTYLAFSTMALNAWGLLTARSASTLRLISIPALCRPPMS